MTPFFGAPALAPSLLYSRGRGVDGVLVTAAANSDDILHQAARMCRKRGRIVVVGVVPLNLVRSDGSTESVHQLQDEVDAGELIVNLRAEADPAVLREAVESALAGLTPGFDVKIEHTECFRPAKPTPTYRMAAV